MTPDRSLWHALSASLLMHAVLIAVVADPPPLHWAAVGRRIDAQIVTPPAAPRVPASAVEAPVVQALAPLRDERQGAASATDRGRRRADKTSSAGVPARPAAKLPGNPPAGNTSPAAPDAVSAEELRQYRVDLAVAARRFNVYPDLAGARGWQGTAEVALEAGARTPAPRVFLLRSSGYPALDAQAVDMLSRAARATPVPAALRARDLRVVIAVRFDAHGEP